MVVVSPWRTGFVAVANGLFTAWWAWQGAWLGAVLFAPIAVYFAWRTLAGLKTPESTPVDE